MTIVRRAAPSAVAAFGPPHERSCTPSGREKVARLLLTFVKADPTAKVWFAK